MTALHHYRLTWSPQRRITDTGMAWGRKMAVRWRETNILKPADRAVFQGSLRAIRPQWKWTH